MNHPLPSRRDLCLKIIDKINKTMPPRTIWIIVGIVLGTGGLIVLALWAAGVFSNTDDTNKGTANKGTTTNTGTTTNKGTTNTGNTSPAYTQILNDNTFNSAIAAYPKSLVMMYSEDCARSMRAYPEYMAAAEQSQIPYFLLPYTGEPARTLDTYNVIDFPAFYLFDNGQATKYTGSHTTNAFLSFTD